MANHTDPDSPDPAISAVASVATDSASALRIKFARLASEWRQERNPYSSDPMDWAMCPSYQKIIAIGPDAIPMILDELRRNPDHWFWALHVLTEQDPVPTEHRGHFGEMVRAWISWGESHELISSSPSE